MTDNERKELQEYLQVLELKKEKDLQDHIHIHQLTEKLNHHIFQDELNKKLQEQRNSKP